MEHHITLQQLAHKLNLEYKGDPNTIIYGMKDIERLPNKDISLLENMVYFIETSQRFKEYTQIQNAIIFTTKELAHNITLGLLTEASIIRLKLIELLSYFSNVPQVIQDKSSATYIHPSAIIDPTAIIMPGAVILSNAKIGAYTKVYPHVTLESGAIIGEHSILYPGVVIGYNCVVGNHCIIYGGTIIGADGFGYYDHADGTRHKIPHIGNVIIKDYVEIGANTTIDRATIESTTIGYYTKIDNQVQIAHNCSVGDYVYIAGLAGLAGSTFVEDYAIIAGGAGIKDHVRIGTRAVVYAYAAVRGDVAPGTVVVGIPAKPIIEHHRLHALLNKLPNLFKRVQALEDK